MAPATLHNIKETPAADVSDFPIEPFSDILFVEQQMEEYSGGGLILAGNHKKLTGGRVVAAGPGRWYSMPMDASGHQEAGMFVPCTTKVGDFVIFGKYQSGGEPLEVNGKRILLCREGDLAGRSKDGKPITVRLAVDTQT